MAEDGELSSLADGDDAIVKPGTPHKVATLAEAMLTRVSRIGPAPRLPRNGRLIAVAGPKGGSGRTTVAVNVALTIAASRRDVRVGYLSGATLLVDGHPGMGDIDVHLDLRSNRSVLDLLAHAGPLEVSALEKALITHRSGLRVLLRPRGVGASDGVTPALWQELLQLVRAINETTVLDLGPGYDDELTLATLEAASVVLVVVTPEIGSVRNARRLLDLAPDLHVERNRFQPVLNRAHVRANLSARDVAMGLGVDLASLIVLPEGGPSIIGHINRGMPVVETRRSALGQALERLAHSLIPTPSASLTNR